MQFDNASEGGVCAGAIAWLCSQSVLLTPAVCPNVSTYQQSSYDKLPPRKTYVVISLLSVFMQQAVTHASSNLKVSVAVKWIAPSAGVGPVVFV